jgi:hypothetical protein
MLKLIVILSYNSIIRRSVGFYISILGIWLILCGATVCCEYLLLSYFKSSYIVGSPCFLGVFLSFYFLLILLDYVFVMDFVYVHISPWWYWFCLSSVVISGTAMCILFYCKICCVD